MIIEIYIKNSNNEVYGIGDEVRVISKSHMHESIGTITSITKEQVILNILCKGFDLIEKWNIEEIAKIRMAKEGENFINDMFYDDEEIDFWETHMITKDGIKERDKRINLRNNG